MAPGAVVALGSREACDPGVVGAKAAALSRARRLGLPVLDGFVLTTEAVALGVATGAQDAGHPVTGAQDAGHPVTGAQDAGHPVTGPLEALRAAWDQLSRGGRVAVVVRSSSTVEDAATASMAGRFASVLDVRGWPAFVTAVGRVVASAAEAGPGDVAPMAVLVQPHLRAELGGVLFTVDPLSGRRTTVVELVDADHTAS